MSDHGGKPYFKIGEVCEITGTQPYVLRFWESEFPNLAPEKNRSGQRIYRQSDIDLIQKIKVLLYDREYTIAGARKVLEAEAIADAGAEAGAGAASRGTDRRKGSSRESREGLFPITAEDMAGEAASSPANGGAERRGASARAGALDDGPRGAGREPGAIPSAAAHDGALEFEVKNLRAKLAHAEAELRAILAEMEQRDQF
jgi:DNA-binding transcriptional MerR regulator